MNNINYSIENFRKSIYDMINNSQLPLGAVYFILKDVFNDVTSAYQNAIMQEAQAMQQAEAEESQIMSAENDTAEE